MADPNPEKPDQPAAAEGAKPEDAADRLNEILSSPVENPFAPEAQPPVPRALAAWEGAKPPGEGTPEAAPAPRAAPASADEAGAPPTSEPAAAPMSQKVPPSEPAPATVPQGAVPDAGATRVLAKVRRLMLISTVLTALAIAAVFGVIGYRVFRGEGRLDAPAQATLTLPQGAKIVQTAIAEDRIVLTLQVGSAVEIRTYDLKTLKPLGQLNFSSVP